MNLTDLIAAAVSKPCDCAACKGEPPQHIQLTGAALEAVHVYQDTLKRLEAEKEAARKAMWEAVRAGTGTEHLAAAALTLDTEYLDIGVVILGIPAGLPLTAAEQITKSQERHIDAGGPPDELLDAAEPAPEQPAAA